MARGPNLAPEIGKLGLFERVGVGAAAVVKGGNVPTRQKQQ